LRVLVYFTRTYPWQSLVVLGCLLLAAVLDGFGLSAVLPVLNLAMSDGAGADAAPPSALELRVLGVLDAFGVPRELGPLVGVLVGVFVVKALILLVAKRRVGYMVAQVATDLRLRLLRALLETRWSYYTRQPVGLAANAMASEASRGAQAYYYLAQVLTYSIQALIAITVALALSWRATLIAAVAAVVSLAALQAFVIMSSRAGRRQTELLKSLLRQLTDLLGAVKLLKAMAREPLVGPLLERDTQRLNKALRKQVLGKESLRALQEPLLVGFCGAGLVAGRMIGMPGSEVGLLILLFARTLASVGRTQRKYQHMVTEESALWSMLGMIEEAEGQREAAGGGAEPTLERSVELRDVGLDYGKGSVLEGVSLEIPAGCVTAIVGASGAGKTSVVDLITGLVPPSAGQVLVDGKPLTELDTRRWRERIGYVPQEVLLLHDSVRTNVTLGDPRLDDADVERALREAGAWDYVSQLPGGPGASVGERGTLLSGGQRQRIAIARALVQKPRLLILDEATAALDPDTEAAVWRTVAGLRGKTTVVAISHQPALVEVADRVYRLQDGTVRLESSRDAAQASTGAVQRSR
jgi:ATP-binding cassette subfamily C protein